MLLCQLLQFFCFFFSLLSNCVCTCYYNHRIIVEEGSFKILHSQPERRRSGSGSGGEGEEESAEAEQCLRKSSVVEPGRHSNWKGVEQNSRGDDETRVRLSRRMSCRPLLQSGSINFIGTFSPGRLTLSTMRILMSK